MVYELDFKAHILGYARQQRYYFVVLHLVLSRFFHLDVHRFFIMKGRIQTPTGPKFRQESTCAQIMEILIIFWPLPSLILFGERFF